MVRAAAGFLLFSALPARCWDDRYHGLTDDERREFEAPDTAPSDPGGPVEASSVYASATTSLTLVPESTSNIVRGNPVCWEDGAFTYDECCGQGQQHQFPEEGAGQESPCWDEIYSFESCCFEPRGNFSDRTTLFGCRNEFFTKYRKDAWLYFKFGEVHPRIFASQARAITNWERHRSLCPPSVLIAILIKLEDDLAMKPIHDGFQGMLQYTSVLQEMVGGFLAVWDWGMGTRCVDSLFHWGFQLRLSLYEYERSG